VVRHYRTVKTTIFAGRVVSLAIETNQGRRACLTIIYAIRSSLDRTRRMFGAAQLPADREQSRVARVIDSFLRACALAH
jgi:hypothetical protein